MKMFSDCSGECCICACGGGGCLAGHGDDDFTPASKEQIIERLSKGEYKEYTLIMVEYLNRLLDNDPEYITWLKSFEESPVPFKYVHTGEPIGVIKSIDPEKCTMSIELNVPKSSISIDSTQCKYYKPRMATLLEYCKCLYKLEGCVCGGSLHILLDDDNYDDDDILFCLNECIQHPDREESELGILICKEYLKLSKEERIVFDNIWNGWESVDCLGFENCEGCPFIAEPEY